MATAEDKFTLSSVRPGYDSVNRRRRFGGEGNPYNRTRFSSGKDLFLVLSGSPDDVDSEEAWMSPFYLPDNRDESLKSIYTDEVSLLGTWLRRFMDRSRIFYGE